MPAQPSDDELRTTFESLGFVTSSVKVLSLLRLARKQSACRSAGVGDPVLDRPGSILSRSV
jgi:hypothetical protein